MEQRERGACWQNADRLDEPLVRALPQGVCVYLCVYVHVSTLLHKMLASVGLVFTEEGMCLIFVPRHLCGGEGVRKLRSK